MDIKYGSGLEFEVDDEKSGKAKAEPGEDQRVSALEDIIREGYRAPVRPTENIALVIGDKSYTVFNLAAGGVGIYLYERDEFELHSFLDSMKLIIGDKELLVKGAVVHLSHDEAHHLCGIKFSDLDEGCQQELAAYLEQTKKSLFS